MNLLSLTPVPLRPAHIGHLLVAALALTPCVSHGAPGNGGEQAKVVIHTDGNVGDADSAPGGGDELTWTIYDPFFFPAASGGPYSGMHDEPIETTVNLSTVFGNCFSFFLYDAGGDGLCCNYGNGYWELRTIDGGLLLRDRFEALPDGGTSPSFPPTNPNYVLGHEFCLPAGPSSIVDNECDVFTNDLLNKVYTTAVPGAVNYEFEISDPDAGARRRIQVPDPWVHFGDMGDYGTLLPGAIYFCRARADLGAPGFTDDAYGTGCEMGIDVSLLVQCTQLVDRPNDPTHHSCGTSKHFGGSDKICALPVLDAEEYLFHFHKVDGTLDRNITSDNYVLVLDWDTDPLTEGDYTVTVEVRIAGAWGGICGAECSLTILQGPGVAVVNQDRFAEQPTVVLYPNPVYERQVRLRMDHLTEVDQPVTVDIYDTFGKRAMTATLPVQDGYVNDMIKLSGDMAAGMYMVNITAGNTVKTERLVIQR
jgi:Secretion system C-terminal sorting domain